MLSKKQLALVFVALWVHVSLLDLFFVTFRGPVFLWAENSEPKTLITHLFIAFLSTFLIWIGSVLLKHYLLGKFKVSETVWVACSACLVISIILVLF